MAPGAKPFSPLAGRRWRDAPDEGSVRYIHTGRRPPHPNPLPAGGEREQRPSPPPRRALQIELQ